MERKRVTILVEVDLDPVPGSFHTLESAQKQISRILSEMIPHYHPAVIVPAKQ